jgi:hypothetical protein
MKSINNTINGLASSLLLNVGLTSVAEKFDTMQSQVSRSANSAEPCIVACNFSAEPCIVACNFSPEKGQ